MVFEAKTVTELLRFSGALFWLVICGWWICCTVQQLREPKEKGQSRYWAGLCCWYSLSLVGHAGH
jgi:hypothetical protein